MDEQTGLRLWFVGLKAAVLVFELTARFDHN